MATSKKAYIPDTAIDRNTHEKYAINDPSLFPHYALLMPQLTAGLPPFLTACTGMDALCHAKVYQTLSEMAVTAGIADKITSNRENAEKFIAAIRELNTAMGIPDRIPELKTEDIPALAGRALREANPLYPVPVIFNRNDMEKVYDKIIREDKNLARRSMDAGRGTSVIQ